MLLDRLHHEEHGVALISALFAVLVLTGLATLFVSRATNESRFSGHSQRFETVLHSAEAGADRELAQANGDPLYTTENPDTFSSYEMGPAVLADEQLQRSTVIGWALAANDNDPATEPGATVRRDGATFFGVRPADDSGTGTPLDLVFAVGFVPALDRSVDTEAEIPPGTQVRVVKYTIAQDYFTPVFALHTGADLTFGGNAQILSEGCDAAAPDDNCDANIQVNGELQNPGTASTVEGQVRVAGGACPTIGSTGGCVDQDDGVEEEPVPVVTARQFYDRYDSDFTPDQGGQNVAWFDLCPDGRVYEPSPLGPCTSTTAVWPDGAQTNWLGWTFSNGKWKATSVSAGVFYVYRADVEINGSDAGSDPTKPRAVSVFVESDPAQASSTGSITVTGNPKLEAAFPDVLFIADRDVRMKGVPSGGTSEYSGFISSYEQLAAGGTVVVTGALLVQDREDLHPEVTRLTDGVDGTMTLNYDRSLSIDLLGYYTITHWSEI